MPWTQCITKLTACTDTSSTYSWRKLNRKKSKLRWTQDFIIYRPSYGEGSIEPDLDPVYMDAQKAGEFGVDCISLYPECEYGYGVLDMISILDWSTFDHFLKGNTFPQLIWYICKTIRFQFEREQGLGFQLLIAQIQSW